MLYHITQSAGILALLALLGEQKRPMKLMGSVKEKQEDFGKPLIYPMY